jgi:hypothetical protein
MIGNDGIGSCKFNYHAITTTTIPFYMSWKRQSMALVGQVLKHSLRVINSMWHIMWYFSSFGLMYFSNMLDTVFCVTSSLHLNKAIDIESGHLELFFNCAEQKREIKLKP